MHLSGVLPFVWNVPVGCSSFGFPAAEWAMPRGRPQINTMTDSQARILREAEAFIREHSISPTVGELGQRLGMTAQSVSEQLQRL